ncbi:MAG TPA: hypothetical protein VGF72_07630 [Gaiellaceae bacterium]|jgi:hypothetical protein
MESRAPRLSFSLDALIAEAKRRARQRRVLVLLLLVAVVAVVAGVTFGSSGGGSRESGVPGQTGGRSDGSQSVQIGPFAVRVPRGFHWAGPLPRPNTQSLTISNVINPLAPNRVELDIGYVASANSPLFRTSQLPLDIDKLHAGESGRLWSGLVSGGGSIYSVHLFFGSKAPAAARASVLRALSSIHRAR